MEDNNRISNKQKELLGGKYINTNTIITDNNSKTSYRVAEIVNDGLQLKKVRSIGNDDNLTFILFSDIIKLYDDHEISISGYTYDIADRTIFHHVISDIIKSKINNDLNNQLNDLVIHKIEINKSGIDYAIASKAGTIKKIISKYNKVIPIILINDIEYKRDDNLNIYANIDGKELNENVFDSEYNIVIKYNTSDKISKRDNTNIKNYIEQFIKSHIYINQTNLVELLFSNETFHIDDIINLHQDISEGNNEIETIPKEIFSWYAISEYAYNLLKEFSDPVLENEYGFWWGRTTYGMAMEDESIMEKIANYIIYPDKMEDGGNIRNDQKMNYESHSLYSYILNDEDENNIWQNTIKEIYKNYNIKDDSIYELSQQLKEYYNANNPLLNESNLYSDILDYGLNNIDYYDIAKLLFDLFIPQTEGNTDNPQNKKEGGKIYKTKNYYRYEIQKIKNADECRTPKWAQNIANSVNENSKILTCKKDGHWHIETILIPNKNISSEQAKKLSKEILDKLDNKKMDLGGKIEDENYDNHRKALSGLRLMEKYNGDKYKNHIEKLNHKGHE